MWHVMTCLAEINFITQTSKSTLLLDASLSTCKPRQLSVTMALYLRSLGIEDGAEQARDGRLCPAEHISTAMTPDKILKGRNANKPIKKDEGCISWYILHLFRYSSFANVCVCRNASISIFPSSRSLHQYGRRNNRAFSSQT